MADHSKTTIETYDRSAAQMAQHFQNYADGVVRKEIEKTFALAGNPENARVVEIGCGAGKDAAEIVNRCSWYEGFDPSAGLLEIARQALPDVSFKQADALSYQYPENLNIVFAFASLLHLEREEFAAVCEKIAQALCPDGVFCLILKEAESYRSELQLDKFGERMFYFYNPKLVRQLAGNQFKQVFEAHELVGPEQKPWFTIILRKQQQS